jgi:hypothetical protein
VGREREREREKKGKSVREKKKSEIIKRSLFCKPYYFVDNLLLIKLFFNDLLFRKYIYYFINYLLHHLHVQKYM